jgi:agmatine deiminase
LVAIFFRAWAVLFSASILFSCNPQQSGYSWPPESAKQEAVIVTYSGDPDDSVMTGKVHSVTQQLLRAVTPSLKVFLLINESDNEDSLIQVFTSKGINTRNIQFVKVYKLFSTGVARDYGPIVVKNNRGERKLLRFQWDYAGADFLHPDPGHLKFIDDVRGRYFSQMKSLLQVDVITNALAIEGGEIESNGAGVAMLVDSFTLRRNPSFSKAQMDSMLHQAMGIKKLIWLSEGVAEDPVPGRSRIYGDIYGNGVGGHIDEFARFADEQTILLAMPDSTDEDPIKKINYRRMKKNYEVLKAAVDAKGNPFKIILVPVPSVLPDLLAIDTTKYRYPVSQLTDEYPELKQQSTVKFLPAASYLNYVVLNDLVIIPEYWQEGFPQRCKDDDAKVEQLFRELFPSKKIIAINPWGMNYAGGGVHCWTQQIPAR